MNEQWQLSSERSDVIQWSRGEDEQLTELRETGQLLL